MGHCLPGGGFGCEVNPTRHCNSLEFELRHGRFCGCLSSTSRFDNQQTKPGIGQVCPVIDSDIEIVARPSNVSGSRSGHAFLECMDHLILAVENLAEAQWYTASACAVSGMVVGTLVDKCNFLGFKGVGPGEEDEEEDMDMEAVDQEAVEQEVAELQKEVLEPWPSDDEM